MTDDFGIYAPAFAGIIVAVVCFVTAKLLAIKRNRLVSTASVSDEAKPERFDIASPITLGRTGLIKAPKGLAIIAAKTGNVVSVGPRKGGTTLFERMANLTRSESSSVEDTKISKHTKRTK
jgi:small ligand-binding sensory domain FIST